MIFVSVYTLNKAIQMWNKLLTNPEVCESIHERFKNYPDVYESQTTKELKMLLKHDKEKGFGTLNHLINVSEEGESSILIIYDMIIGTFGNLDLLLKFRGLNGYFQCYCFDLGNDKT